MTYIVTGGIYKDFTFEDMETVLEYGPFETYEEAFDIWKAQVWQNVDNALHRLEIEEMEKEPTNVHCVCCGKELQNISRDGHQPYDGLAFHTYGHYGSTYFDPMNGSYLQLSICDECVEKAESKGFVFRKDSGTNEIW